jgi:hypothetical protein
MIAVSSALTLLTNVVMAWNTLHMQRAVELGGQPVLPHLLRGIGPTSLEGINLRGAFDFPIADYAERLMPGLNSGNPFPSKRTRRLTGSAVPTLWSVVSSNLALAMPSRWLVFPAGGLHTVQREPTSLGLHLVRGNPAGQQGSRALEDRVRGCGDDMRIDELQVTEQIEVQCAGLGGVDATGAQPLKVRSRRSGFRFPEGHLP